jgi:hypothetical protein
MQKRSSERISLMHAALSTARIYIPNLHVLLLEGLREQGAMVCCQRKHQGCEGSVSHTTPTESALAHSPAAGSMRQASSTTCIAPAPLSSSSFNYTPQHATQHLLAPHREGRRLHYTTSEPFKRHIRPSSHPLPPTMANGWAPFIGAIVVAVFMAAAWFLSPKGENQTYAPPPDTWR